MHSGSASMCVAARCCVDAENAMCANNTQMKNNNELMDFLVISNPEQSHTKLFNKIWFFLALCLWFAKMLWRAGSCFGGGTRACDSCVEREFFVSIVHHGIRSDRTKRMRCTTLLRTMVSSHKTVSQQVHGVGSQSHIQYTSIAIRFQFFFLFFFSLSMRWFVIWFESLIQSKVKHTLFRQMEFFCRGEASCSPVTVANVIKIISRFSIAHKTLKSKIEIKI